MTEQSGEDLIVVGPERPPRSATWVAALAVAGLVVGAFVLEAQRSGPPTRHGADRSIAVTAPRTPAPVRRVDDEYLVEVPSGDMRVALASAACRSGCTAHTLTGLDLEHAAAGFAGLRALAGGLVTAGSTSAVQQSIEGRARPDALVHLVVQRTARPSSPAVQVSDQPGDGFRSVRTSMVRSGWLFTATVVVRGTAPPVAAAVAWAAGAPLPSAR